MVGGSRGVVHTWVPPRNFALVENGIYRSAYPSEENVPYLRHIGIRTVALLSIESLSALVLRSLAGDAAACGNRDVRGMGVSKDTAAPKHSTMPSMEEVKVVQLATMESWKCEGLSSMDDFSQRDVQRALDMAVDTRWHPLLFACPTGELQTSVVTGCMRRYQCWSLSSILCECELFANISRTVRSSVMLFIEMWNPELYPIIEADLVRRNREWDIQEHLEQAQLRRRHRDGRTSSRFGAVSSSSSGDVSEEDKSSPYSRLSPKKSSRLFPAAPLVHDKEPLAQMEAVTSRVSEEREVVSAESLAVLAPTRRAHVGSHIASTPPKCAERGKASVVTVAEWFVLAQEYWSSPSRYSNNIRTRQAIRAPTESGPQSLCVPPHERYAGVRNPPAIDPRSTFTKESIVEEDDD